jgi:hypothetical protein
MAVAVRRFRALPGPLAPLDRQVPLALPVLLDPLALPAPLALLDLPVL